MVTEEETAPRGASVGFTAYVPRVVRQWQPAPGDTGAMLDVEGTLLSADLSGFTALSEKLTRLGREGAEELTRLLNGCFAGMIAEMEARGGDILKFGGDALLVLFTGVDHAARACDAALATRTFVKTPLRASSGASVKLRISQGLDSGTYHLFAVRGQHVEVLITGPGATEAVTCEAEADAGEILLSAACAGRVDPARLGGSKGARRLLRGGAQHDRAMERDAVSAAVPRPAKRGADLATFVPLAQRDYIAAGGAEEHRRATVAFLKFSHTDGIIEREGAGVLAARLAALARAIAAAEDRHGVHWLATDIYPDGGKCILTAGAPASTGNDEDAMLGALRDILDAGIDLELAAGVNAGPVFMGNVGASSRRTFTVMGDAVNLAARLMQKATKGTLIASDSVFAEARNPFELRPLDAFQVKGKTQQIHAAAVGRRLDGVTTTTARLPLTGRDAEFARIIARVEAARSGAGAVIEIIGEAGMGKTRLIEELRALTGLRSIGVICGRYAQASSYFAARLMLRTVAGIDPQSPRDHAGRVLREFVMRTAPELERWLPLIATPFDAEVEMTREASRVAPVHRRARAHQLIVELLSAAVKEPTAFIVDDAHWIDDASHDLVQAMARVAAARPWVICVGTRPAPVPVFGETIDCERVELALLPAEAARALAFAARGDEADLLPDAWSRIVKHASGNPLFVIELAAAASGEEQEALPQSIESIVTSRIDTLAATDRLLLRDASVLGMVVDTKLLAEALDNPSLVAPRRWVGLQAFLAPMKSGVLAFRQDLYHQAAYDGLPFGRRRHIHRRIGAALEERGAAGDAPELLSVHFSRAGDHERAWRYSVLAADRARERYANVESAMLYGRAIESARHVRDVDPAAVVAVLESLGDVCELGARYDAATRAYAEARQRAASIPVMQSSSAPARLCRKSGAVSERLGRYSQALRWYGKGLRLANLADRGKPNALRAGLKVAYAGVRYRQGRYRDMLRWAHEAADEAEASGDQPTLGHAYLLLELGYASIGSAKNGVYARKAVEIYTALDDYVGLSRSLNNLGITSWRHGDWNEALDFFRRSRLAYERSGDFVGAAMADSNAAEILSDQGRLDEAIAVLRDALAICRSAHYPSGAAVILGNLGQAEARSGHPVEGLRRLRESLASLEKLGASGYEAEALVKEKEALVLAGLFDDVLRDSRELLVRLDASEEDVLGAALQRYRALALDGVGQSQEAWAAVDDSIERAEAGDAAYELGKSLLVRAALRPDSERASADASRGRALLAGLGVVE